MTYTEAINELMSLCEAVCTEYEFDIIAEAADGGISDESKEKHANKIIAILKKIWEFVKNICGKIKALVLKIFGAAKGDVMTVKADCEVPTIIAHPSKAVPIVMAARHALRGGINSGSKDPKIISELIILTNKETVKAGTKLATSDVYMKLWNVLEDLEKNGSDGIDRINPSTPVQELYYKNELYGTISKLYSAYYSGIDKLVSIKTLEQKPAEQPATKAATQNESVEFRSEEDRVKYVSCMLEAANALRYGKILAEDVNSTTDPAKQKDVDDIPEETPVENKEYPEDTSGGEGKQEDHLEDAKDLVDGDSKAMDLLTKDDNGKTITESMDLVFDL